MHHFHEIFDYTTVRETRAICNILVATVA